MQSGRRRRQWRRRLQPARRGVRQWDPAAVLAPRSCLAPRLQRPKGAARSPGGPRARTLPRHIIPGRLWSGEEDNIDVCGEQLVVTRWLLLSHGPAVLCLPLPPPLSTRRNTVHRRHPTCSMSVWAQM